MINYSEKWDKSEKERARINSGNSGYVSSSEKLRATVILTTAISLLTLWVLWWA